MSTSDLEPYFEIRPFPTLRLTLSSGDQMVIREQDGPVLAGLSIVLRGVTLGRMTYSPRLISVPNIVLVEPVPDNFVIRRRRR